MVSLLLFRLPIAILCPFIDQSTLVIDSLYKFIQLNRYLVVDHSLWSCTFQSMGNNILSFKSHYYFVALLAKRKSHITKIARSWRPLGAFCISNRSSLTWKVWLMQFISKVWGPSWAFVFCFENCSYLLWEKNFLWLWTAEEDKESATFLRSLKSSRNKKDLNYVTAAPFSVSFS